MSHIARSLFLLLLACAALPGWAAAQGQLLQIFVSIPPQKYFVERVGGDHVQVSVLVGAGQSPATFEPTPGQMAGLSRAQLFYRIGVPFESVWMQRLLALNPNMSVLDARQGLQLRQLEPAGGHRHDDDRGLQQEHAADPHVWLSPARVRTMAAALRDRLSELDPAHSADYQAGFKALDDDLVQLDLQIRERLSALEAREFMVFHPSWGYFADDYGLRQIPIESEGKEPGARTLARLVQQARAQGIQVIFVQRQFSQAQAHALAQQLGARVVAIDPLSEQYIDNLLRVADAIAGFGR